LCRLIKESILLVDEKYMADMNNEIVVFRSFENSIDANIAKTKLDAYGIPCFLTEENMANLYPGQSFNAFKIRLHLFAADCERAGQILSSDELIMQADALTCPNCYSMRITRSFPKRLADTLLYIFFGIFMTHRKVNVCDDCGHEF
jgi:hypothetical protein